MKTSDAGVELIKGFEGLRLNAYQDSAGVWTIGFGHAGQDVRPGDTITEAEAERLLRLDLTAAELAVQRLVTAPLNQHQFDALVSFTYNLGAGNLKGSTLLRFLNAGNYEHAAQQFGLWVHAGGQRLEGLVRRRAAERFLFEQPMPADAGDRQPPPAPVEDRTLPPYVEEPAMPAPLVVPILSALVPALLPKVAGLIPELANIFGDRSKESSAQYVEAGVKVLETITAATGARNAQEAVERIAADPVAKESAQTAVRAAWFDLQEVAGGIDAAREHNAALAPLPRLGLRFHEVLSLLTVTGAYAVGSLYLFTGSPAPEMAAALVTALVIAALGSVVAYWFGSTSGSALKSELLAKK